MVFNYLSTITQHVTNYKISLSTQNQQNANMKLQGPNLYLPNLHLVDGDQMVSNNFYSLVRFLNKFIKVFTTIDLHDSWLQTYS